MGSLASLIYTSGIQDLRGMRINLNKTLKLVFDDNKVLEWLPVPSMVGTDKIKVLQQAVSCIAVRYLAV